MVESKENFLKKFLPEKVTDLDYVQLNLDVTDLSISDILRNLHKLYPINGRKRNAIISGSMVVGVLCKTETLEPLKGLFLIITNGDLDFEIYSSNYIVLCIDESKIRNESDIVSTIDKITGYLATNFVDQLYNLPDFYRKFVYDIDEEFDDYIPIEGFYRM